MELFIELYLDKQFAKYQQKHANNQTVLSKPIHE